MTAPLAGRRVLILDDDPLVGLLVETVARLGGAVVLLTAGADEFLVALDAFAPTHLVLDLTLPTLAGEEVLRRVALRGCSARVVIYSGAEPQRLLAAAELARDAGLCVAGTLAKPFATAALRALLA